jgi:hypothetical protein
MLSIICVPRDKTGWQLKIETKKEERTSGFRLLAVLPSVSILIQT